MKKKLLAVMAASVFTLSSLPVLANAGSGDRECDSWITDPLCKLR